MTEYLLAFPATADPNVTAASVMKIYVASEYENLTVNLLNSSNNVIQSVLLSTSKAFSEMVVPSEYIMSGSELSRKALRLSAAMEFKAQVFNSNTPPADGYLALPIDYLGRSYLVTSFCAYYGYCQVVLAAMIKKTIVTIILPSMSDPRDIVYCDKGVIKTPVNKKIHITMDALDVFQIESKEDLTGTIIVSSYDISVFVGGRNISSTQPGSNIVEQLLPKKHWGTEFIVKSKVSHMYSDVVHIQTLEDNTKLEMTDLLNVTVQNGDETVVQRLTDANNFFHIKASKPVQVVHYSQVLRSDNAVGVNPSMTLVQSFQHWSKSYLFNCIGGVNYTLITNRNESLVNRQVIWKTSLNAFSVSERNNVLYLTHQEPFGAILESCGMGGASMLLGIGMYSSGTSSTTTDTTLVAEQNYFTLGFVEKGVELFYSFICNEGGGKELFYTYICRERRGIILLLFVTKVAGQNYFTLVFVEKGVELFYSFICNEGGGKELFYTYICRERRGIILLLFVMKVAEQNYFTLGFVEKGVELFYFYL
ncbi:hypothetical protein ACJMK2_032983 [Sinanodonta woodiana]|uniref:IgGFc-binding protein N-terminal domain-containing protein n=1 Tax=Sinanodonta woodiana TaxID=1069815 RepID=A0ABD3X7E8_SINWO